MNCKLGAVILKNRNGETGDTLHFAYYPMFNKFLDMDTAEDNMQSELSQPKTKVDEAGRVVTPGGDVFTRPAGSGAIEVSSEPFNE